MTTGNIESRGELKIYWLPGCSSCLRMKEFVEKMGVPHEEVNLAAHPERVEELTRIGLFPPAAVIGEEGVPGVNLVGIAKLVGYDYDPPPILEPAVLKQRYDEIAGVAASLIEQLPPDGLDYKSPDRDRTMRRLSAHVATIMRGFTVVEETNIYTYGGEFIPDAIRESGTLSEILALFTETREDFEEWWKRIGYDDPFDRVLESKWGFWTLQEALERSVWHTAQHTRQLQYFLEDRLGVTPRMGLTEEMLSGLPLPDGIHA